MVHVLLWILIIPIQYLVLSILMVDMLIKTNIICKGQEYILAARTLGASDSRLMFKHIFPNSLGTIITSSVLVIPSVIFSESSLTYLGIVNLDSSTRTSVGTMLANGRQFLSTFPHIILFPALFISLLMISFNLFGNGLRDAFNPALRGSDD